MATRRSGARAVTGLPVRIAGTGLYAPGEPIDNAELKRLAKVEFDHERLEGKLGIHARHVARLRGLDESSADFATTAAKAALAAAGASADDLDLIIVATDTPEYVSPATAVVVQGRLQGGERPCRSFDVNASCGSFVTALDAATALLSADVSLRRALVVGVYGMPAHLRPGDAFGWSIFADGAGAVVLERTKGRDRARYLGSSFVTDGTQFDFIGVYAGGTRRPVTHEALDRGTYGLELLQKLPGDRNVKLWPPLLRRAALAAGLTVDQLDHVLFTQINRSVIVEVMQLLELPMERTTCVMDRYGYTGSACIPMALHHAAAEGRIRRGDRVALVASGAGLVAGAAVLVY